MNFVEKIAVFLLFGVLILDLINHEKRIQKVEDMHIIKVCPIREINNANTVP